MDSDWSDSTHRRKWLLCCLVTLTCWTYYPNLVWLTSSSLKSLLATWCTLSFHAILIYIVLFWIYDSFAWHGKPLQVAYVSEALKCWGAWYTTSGRRAKDITPSTAWRRKRGRKRKRSTTFPERAIVSQTKKYWNWPKASLWNSWETGWSAYRLLSA